MQYCTKCVYPSVTGHRLVFDEKGVCSACRVSEPKKKLNWAEREAKFKAIAEQYRSKNGSNYDCIIPVSGGKDSYFQTHHVTKVLGLKPLLVTYHGNNYTEEGERNLARMRHVFDADHIIFRPSESLLIRMNRLCFRKMGDMNWHNHCGIYTYPVQIAVAHKIPLIIWGEHGTLDLSGMFSFDDYPEMSARDRLEHGLRGFDWFDMIDKEEGIREQDLLWAKYPTDEELESSGVRGLYMGNYVYWESNAHYKLVHDLYGWEELHDPLERTYRRFSNLDDMHENGAHDYLKYIKFGYGRGSDHACKDIRAGLMTREQGIAMVRKYDHVKSKDVYRWLAYVGMTEAEFDRIADTFRDPRVWRKNEQGEWEKENIWDSKN
ncbi:N-acetyl sugar amidotransferase [Candidatus Uhrbacteria bacterium]|nr:N-acetyl sugar amidotransferase [Candidatus Uhrbacteria bacterium]